MKFHVRQFAITWLLDPITDVLKKLKKKKQKKNNFQENFV